MKIKLKGKSQKAKGFFLLFTFYFLFFTFYFLLIDSPILAQQTATSSADNAFKQKVKALQADIASKAANIKLEVTNKIQNKAILGQVITTDGREIDVMTT